MEFTKPKCAKVKRFIGNWERNVQGIIYFWIIGILSPLNNIAFSAARIFAEELSPTNQLFWPVPFFDQKTKNSWKCYLQAVYYVSMACLYIPNVLCGVKSPDFRILSFDFIGRQPHLIWVYFIEPVGEVMMLYPFHPLLFTCIPCSVPVVNLCFAQSFDG